MGKKKQPPDDDFLHHPGEDADFARRLSDGNRLQRRDNGGEDDLEPEERPRDDDDWLDIQQL